MVQRQLGALLELLQLGSGLVQKLLLRGIKLVLRVHGMADEAQGNGGLHAGEHLLQGGKGLIRFGKALGAIEGVHVLLDLLPEKIHIRPNIGHVRKQHGSSSCLE